VFDRIRSDIHRYANALGPRAQRRTLRVLFYSFGLQAVVVYRFGRWLREGKKNPRHWIRVPLFPAYWLLNAYVRTAYDIHLDLSADIGAGLHVWHFGGLHVSDCQLGRCCTIHQRVHIGASDKLPGPWIGDQVWIGPHARIVGHLRVGTGATIGAGAVVTRDVPERSVIMGNPARVIMMGYDNRIILGLEPPAPIPAPDSHAERQSSTP
jgi:serine O-acetyltransferase